MFEYDKEKYRDVVKAKPSTKTWNYKRNLIYDNLTKIMIGKGVLGVDKFDILELGCGEIPFFEDSVKIDIAKTNLQNSYVRDLNEPFKIRGKKFDIIVSSELMGHLHNSDRFLKEVFNHLKDDGVFVVSARNVGWLRTRINLLLGNDSWFDNDGYYLEYFTPKSFVEKLERRGFELISIHNKKSKLPLSLSHGFICFFRKNKYFVDNK